MITERRKIEFLTDAASGFRGLPLVVFGLVMTILMVLNYVAELDSQRVNAAGKDLTIMSFFVFICLILLVVGYPKMRAHFSKKFGQTKAKPKTFQDWITALFMMAPILVSFLWGVPFDATQQVSFSLTILLAAFTFVCWLLNYRGVSNGILYLSVLFVAISFLPWQQIFLVVTVRDDYFARAAFYRAVCSLLIGITYTAMGLVDYLILKKMLKPIEREEKIYESV